MAQEPSVKVGDIPILFRRLKEPELGVNGYDGPAHSVTILKAGHRKEEDVKAFGVDTIYEKDVEIPMRDGIILKGDIFRPATSDSENVPAIIPWSPYGKTGRGLSLNFMPGRMGVPRANTSGYEKFEAPDPAEWTARGYAVVNIDSRGAWDSQGYLCWAGTQEGRDGYDAIEWIAKLPWCTGSVATAGNSWLGRSQWYIAAERPPSLKCIAPLEGSGDLYREIHVRGGIACTPFLEWMMTNLRGRGYMEDPVAMLKKYPLMNDYWKDKRAQIFNIEVPAYVLASYSTFLHLPGSLRGFDEIPHNDKWLRVHESQEWHDLYQKRTTDELQIFFDRYLKGIENGWETTPQVRVSLLGYNQPNIRNQVYKAWPPAETKYTTLFAGTGDQLLVHAATDQSFVSYQSDVDAQQVDNDTEELHFRLKIPERTFLIGAVKAVLYLSCDDVDDMDIFLQVRKANKDGLILRSYNVPDDDMAAMGIPREKVPLVNPVVYLGPHGQIRASHRAIDMNISKPHYISHAHLVEERIRRGSVVRVETSIWPGGIIFENGEYLVIKVSGHPMYLAEFPTLRGAFKANNKGLHKVWIGGESASHFVVPFVEPPI
ncbi:hypothetical protein LTR84_006547 [Exophiala bonariae]|uniref:Xaa-Pro dipeptidyl-peptidase C-terminal domain-containing protein n=1 Tax=Exophiala bonariae TaxID=1690606 RepID=A0AAV9N0F3_9EURO|nr:hypothetical protein LTR84_006547 [Exophiala bonariae]